MATHIPHEDAVAKELEGRREESKEKEESDDDIINQIRSAQPITVKGNDPPPSDGQLGKRAETRKLKFQQIFPRTLNKIETPGWDSPQKNLEGTKETLEGEKPIKKQRTAHQKDSSPSIPQPQIPKNNESKPTCIPEMNQQANIPSAPQNIQSFAAVCGPMPAIHQTQQPVYRIRPEGPEIQVQSCPNQCQPGLMAATHLARID